MISKPDLYTLLKQFNAIGGIAETGQAGFCLLMALWQKSNELNWSNRFTMTNTELVYRAGFNNVQTLSNVRNKLKQLKYIDYIPPKNRRCSGTYVLNFDLLGIKKSDCSTTLNSDFNSSLNSDFNRPFNSSLNSPFNINKPNQTKLNKEEDKDAREFAKVISVFGNNIHPPTPIEAEKISQWLEEVDADVCIHAITEAVNYNARSMSYINSILNDYTKKSIKTKADLDAYLRDKQDQKKSDVVDFEKYKRGEADAQASSWGFRPIPREWLE